MKKKIEYIVWKIILPHKIQNQIYQLIDVFRSEHLGKNFAVIIYLEVCLPYKIQNKNYQMIEIFRFEYSDNSYFFDENIFFSNQNIMILSIHQKTSINLITFWIDAYINNVIFRNDSWMEPKHKHSNYTSINSERCEPIVYEWYTNHK